MRIFKIISIVLVLIVAIYYLLEFGAYTHYVKISHPYSAGDKTFKEYFMSRLPEFFVNEYGSFDKIYENHYFRPPMGTEYEDSNPILIFGGSYAKGHELKDEETLQYKLAQGTKSKVLNFSGNGWGPQNMLYQLKRDDFYSKVGKTPSSILYLYMCADSIYTFREVFINEHQVFYTETANGLARSKFSAGYPFYGYFLKQMRRVYAQNFISKEKRKSILIKHFIDARKEVNKRWGDVPFNILVYSYEPETELDALECLHRLGFNVQYASKIAKEDLGQLKYQRSEYDMHPNALAWEVVTPEFIKNMKR